MMDCNVGSELRALMMKRILNLSSSNFPIFVSLSCMQSMLSKVQCRFKGGAKEKWRSRTSFIR